MDLWICLYAWCVQENVEILTKRPLELYDLDYIGCNFVHLFIFLFVIFSSGSVVRAGNGIKKSGVNGYIFYLSGFGIQSFTAVMQVIQKRMLRELFDTLYSLVFTFVKVYLIYGKTRNFFLALPLSTTETCVHPDMCLPLFLTCVLTLEKRNRTIIF